MVPAWTQDPQVRYHPLPWPDDRHRLLGREKAILIEPLVRSEFVSFAEQPFKVLLRDVAVSRRDIHHQPRRLPSPLLQRRGVGNEGLRRWKSLQQRLPHQPFHDAAVQGHHERNSSDPLVPATMSRTSW